MFAAQRALADEIGPEVERLLNRVEQYLAKLERREQGLIAKAELQDGRLNAGAPRPRMTSRATGGGVEDQAKKVERLKIMQSKRERLEHTIERLSLQITHKVRYILWEDPWN